MKKFFNLWRGFSVEPAEPGATHPSVDRYFEHLHENICAGSDELHKWLVDYFAHLVQRPWEKPLVALVLKGGKGVGKNAALESMGRLLGNHFLLSSNRRYLVGNFNGHLENLLFFVLDEAFWSGDKQAEGQLKDLITGGEHVIEHKGKETYTVANCTRIGIIGNEEWLVPASHDERRYAVFEVTDKRKGHRDYFVEMLNGLESGGNAVLLRTLLDRDITAATVSEAPSTAGLLEQKHASLDGFETWWLECLTGGRLVGSDFGGEWPTKVDCERFRSAFRRWCKEQGIGRYLPDERAIGKKLARCAPGVGRVKNSKGAGESSYSYTIPPLQTSRDAWSTHIGHEIAWE